MQVPEQWLTKPPLLSEVMGFAYYVCRASGDPDVELLDAIRPFVDRDAAMWRLQTLREIPPERDYVSSVERRILERLFADRE